MSQARLEPLEPLNEKEVQELKEKLFYIGYRAAKGGQESIDLEAIARYVLMNVYTRRPIDRLDETDVYNTILIEHSSQGKKVDDELAKLFKRYSKAICCKFSIPELDEGKLISCIYEESQRLKDSGFKITAADTYKIAKYAKAIKENIKESE